MKILKEKLKSNINKLNSILEYPELINAKRKNINTWFAKDLLFIKNTLNILPNTIFDVGAAIGKWTEAANFVFPNIPIYAFEPVTESYEKLKRNTKNINNITCYNMALSSKNECSSFYKNEYSFASSLSKATQYHKELFPFASREKVIKVQCKRLYSIQDIIIKEPAILKIDVQGAELEVLRGASDLLDKICLVELEVSFGKFYEVQPDYDEIFTFMRKHNFMYFKQIHEKYNSFNKMLFCDILFYK